MPEPCYPYHMRYGIFSDIHANLEAFEALLKFYWKERIDKFIFNGDIVGYGADPSECISLLKSLNPVIIAGNHDCAVTDKLSLNYFNDQAKEALLWTKNELKKEDTAYLNTFPLTYQEDDFVCVHSTLNNPLDFGYIRDAYDAQINFSHFMNKVCFIGHSHRMEAYCLEKQSISYMCDCKIKIYPRTKYIINIGSVGQPRDKDPRICACIYDNKKGMVNFIRLEYNIKKAADKILNKALPSIFAQRLYEGR